MLPAINTFQHRVLKKLANSLNEKSYLMPAGIESDRKREEIDADFASILALVDLGLLVNASRWPIYSPLVREYKKKQGRRVIVVVPTRAGELMFKRVRHGKWRN